MTRPMIMATALGVGALIHAMDLAAQTVVLEPYVVTATRAPTAIFGIPFSVRVVDSDELASAPALTLDGALRSVPGFSLFRRSDSLYAHPTTQGVSLRGLGPSGASRTLVLLDGVPVNDPFGGWIAWNKLPRGSLERVELVRGGGATAWGNAALGGVIHLISKVPVPGTATAQVTTGAFSLVSGEGALAQDTPAGVVEVSGRAFRTDGFETIAPESRGPVDIPAGQRHRWISARLHANAGEHTKVVVTGRVFSEHRGNGTPLQNNQSREAFGSVALNHLPADGVRWMAVVFGQDQEFSSTFSSVSARRDSETPASDQFSVPATAWGFAWTAFFGSASAPDSGSSTTAGFDFRQVSGETHEDSGFSNGTFTRRRIAGGSQAVGGVFAVHTRDISETVRFTGGLRADRWSDTSGFRRESVIATGEITRLDQHPKIAGWELSPSAGIAWSAAQDVRIRVAAQRAFRRPTLNELHRPFRVGAFVTESNPVLKTENVSTVEVGIDWSHGPVMASVTFFHHDMRDAVANVTVIHGPGTFPGFGFIPAGGAGRRRLNIDQVVAEGAEISATIRIGESLRFTADYLLSDARVRRGNPAQGLEDKQLVQVPRHSANFALQWTGPGGLVVNQRLRWFSRQFEDDENLLPLAGAAIADLSVSMPASRSAEFFLLCENVAGTRVETGLTAAGVVSTGTPRMFLAGIRASW